jgi:AbrB family looped-hinge helix DNA binding protein
MEAYATVKGQIVIPSKIRRRLGITESTRIQIDLDEENKKIVLTPITREYIHSVRGRLKGKGLLKSLAAEKKIEKEL